MDNFFGNWLDDSVIREDENGNRYIKRFTPGKAPVEVAVSADCKAAFGGQGYGEVHELSPISPKDYERFGIAWEWGKTPGKRMIHIDYNSEFSNIPDLVRHGVFIEMVKEQDEEDLIKYLQRIYVSIDSNRTIKGIKKTHFKDPTALKLDDDGQIIVPLNLEGLTGLYKQFQNDRKLRYIEELEEQYPGIKEILDILHTEGYLTGTYNAQVGITGVELKLLSLLIQTELNRKINWKTFEAIFEFSNLVNFEILRGKEEKQKAIYRLFSPLVVEKVKHMIESVSNKN